ncbi:hypothetical protein B0H13DRAFT_2036522 [Mycena leptocephala]|nr:hypothetical protein B0H13DRAFT_2036522 [Mycena leptocephala]
MSACLRAIATVSRHRVPRTECFHSPCCVDGHYGARTFSVVRCVLYEMVIGSGGTMAISPSRRRDGASQRSRCAPRSYRSYVRFASFHLLSAVGSQRESSFLSLVGFICIGFFPIFLSFCGGLLHFGGGSEVRSCERAAFRLSCPWAWNWPGRDGRGGRYPSPISGPRSSNPPNLRLRLRSLTWGWATRLRPGDVDVWAGKGKRGADGSRWDAGAGAVPRAGV